MTVSTFHDYGMKIRTQRFTFQRSKASMICELFGITEADIRDITPLPNYDVYRVRTYNWRAFFVTGYDLVNGKLDAFDQTVNWAQMMPTWWQRKRQELRRKLRRKWRKLRGKKGKYEWLSDGSLRIGRW